LNVPEATALIADTVAETARDGARLSEAVTSGQIVLGPDDVLPGVAAVVNEVWVEAVFDDGSRLVVVPNPIGGNTLGQLAPGALLHDADDEEPDAPAATIELTVENTASPSWRQAR